MAFEIALFLAFTQVNKRGFCHLRLCLASSERSVSSKQDVYLRPRMTHELQVLFGRVCHHATVLSGFHHLDPGGFSKCFCGKIAASK